MSYLNFVIGTGGTGCEIIQELLKIQKRYPCPNDIEWFILDTKDNKKGISRFAEDNALDLTEIEINDRVITLDQIQDTVNQIKLLKEEYDDSNIDKVFNVNSQLLQGHTRQGAWEKRVLGYIAFINHIFIEPENYIGDKIIDKLNHRPNGKTITAYVGINFYIVSSLAGGSGSGMFLALNAFLKNLLIKNGFNNPPISFYHLLATPETVAKGTRKPITNQSKENFDANAYSALKELQIIMDNTKTNFNWLVKSSSTETLIDVGTEDLLFENVFIFSDKNTEGEGFTLTKGINDYLPGFMMIAWNLYLLCSADTNAWGIIPQPLGAKANKKTPAYSRFQSMGCYIIEDPKSEIFSKCIDILFDKVRETSNKNDSYIIDDIGNMSIDKFTDLLPASKLITHYNSIMRIVKSSYQSKIANSRIEEIDKVNIPDMTDIFTKQEMAKKKIPTIDDIKNNFHVELQNILFQEIDTNHYNLSEISKILELLKLYNNTKKTEYEYNIPSDNEIQTAVNGAIMIKGEKWIRKAFLDTVFDKNFNKIFYGICEDLSKYAANKIQALYDCLFEIKKTFLIIKYNEYSNCIGKRNHDYFNCFPVEKSIDSTEIFSKSLISDKAKKVLEKDAIVFDKISSKDLKQFFIEIWKNFSKTKTYKDLIEEILQKSINMTKEETEKFKKKMASSLEASIIDFLDSSYESASTDFANKVKDSNNVSIYLKKSAPYINVIRQRAGKFRSHPFYAVSRNQLIDVNTFPSLVGIADTDFLSSDRIFAFYQFLSGCISFEDISGHYKAIYEQVIKDNILAKFIDPAFESYKPGDTTKETKQEDKKNEQNKDETNNWVNSE